MQHLILKILITGLFFILTQSVKAENQAGGSATLSLSVKIGKEEQTAITLNKKEMAIKSVLERYSSPMVGEEKSFINACRLYNLDCYLLPSIAGLESTFGRFIWPGSYNPFGWDRGYMMFNSWPESIDTVGRGLRENYINKWGLLSVDQIGSIYSESPTWSKRVLWFINEFKKEEEKMTLIWDKIPVKL